VTGGVNHSRNNDQLTFFDYFINHAIGKSFWIAPADVLGRMLSAVQKWIYLKGVKYREDFFDEFSSRPGR